MIILFSSNYSPLVFKNLVRLEDIHIANYHDRENIYAITKGILPANINKDYVWFYDKLSVEWIPYSSESLPAKNKAEWLLLKDNL